MTSTGVLDAGVSVPLDAPAARLYFTLAALGVLGAPESSPPLFASLSLKRRPRLGKIKAESKNRCHSESGGTPGESLP
jgi:hypothetical protein